MVKEPTEEQSKILQQKGNIVITAKPGSGKTYTIVEKIARVIPDLPEYKGVIAISFTNKASDELKRRCKQRCADTKQSFFGTIDKFYISQIIIPFSSHVTGNITEYEIVDNIDESSKYALLLEEPFSSKKESILVEGLQEGKIFLKYTGETALYILENVPGAMQYIKARYSHIIIDEYQDCGEIQDKVFIKLVESGLTGIAVGDINQAIYGFTKRFPKYLIALMKRDDFARFELSKNHRCHPSISEYSLCLFGASKTVPREKRVFKVDISGDERNIAAAIDKIKELAGLVYAQKETKVALNNLHSVIRDPHQLKNYVPARENELNIMTLHKSKGLEFNIVFHMDMYKWIIPNEFGDESSVQQDLNLHYVGLTRAKDACYIMNGTARFRSKKNDYIFAEPSLFLSKPGLAERRKDVRWEM